MSQEDIMQKKTGPLIAALAVLSLLAGTASLYADMGPRHPGRDIFQKLDLTADQKAKIQTLRADSEKAVIALRAEIQTAQVDLKTEMRKDTLDLTKIGQLADTITSKSAAIQKNRIMLRAQIIGLLTKDQRGKLEQLWDKQEMKCRPFSRGEHEDEEHEKDAK